MNDIYSVLTDAFPELKPEIELTWTPKWTSEFITPEGRKLLDIA
jgi:metal-sulfur cluster biosynthetic enzyme